MQKSHEKMLPAPRSGASNPVAETKLSAATIILRTLKSNGVDWFIGNPGTDFAPIVEVFARASRDHEEPTLPRPVLVAHETTAISMAHGIWLATAQPAAVMVHVNVGVANALCNVINAARDRVPLVLLSGRTPITQEGHNGSRSGYIHWGQEMFDQGAMLRELVRWDYEMRMAEQAGAMTARAIEIACSEPTGPVYLSLPREVLAEETPLQPTTTACSTVTPHCDPGALDWLAEKIAMAKHPVILTSAAGRDLAAVAELAALAEAAHIPVVECSPRYLNMPRQHPWHGGYDAAPWLSNADLVIVIESEVPWFPGRAAALPDAIVVHIGIDPVFASYPMRDFPRHRNIAGAVAPALRELTARLAAAEVTLRNPPKGGMKKLPAPGPLAPLTFDEVSLAVSAIVDETTVIFNEYPLRPGLCPLSEAGSYYALSPAGGLGWGLGAALGYKLARPDRFVVATLGDGAYLYSNPIAALLTAHAEQIAILIVVFNNRGYGGVKRAINSMYGQGVAESPDGRLWADLSGTPDYAELASKQGAFSETVETRETLADALARGRTAVMAGRLALINVVIPE